jgi:hypothetical protein
VIGHPGSRARHLGRLAPPRSERPEHPVAPGLADGTAERPRWIGRTVGVDARPFPHDFDALSRSIYDYCALSHIDVLDSCCWA